MADRWPTLPLPIGRGLNLVDSPELLEDGEARVITNFEIVGRGRIAPRKAAVEIADVDGEHLLICPFRAVAGAGAVLLSWDDTTDVVNLYTVSANGTATLVGALAGWTSVTTRPVVHAADIAGVLFIVDANPAIADRYGMTCFDPADFLGSSATGGLFQPTFDFDFDGAGHAVLKAAYIIEHLNHLWAFGYGDETDPDHPEVGHFSYPGLDTADGGYVDVGDAGTGGATGSLGLFDAGDAVPVVKRGSAIIAAASASGRLVVASDTKIGAIFGSDRDSWRFEVLDGERGAACSRALVVADGIVYGLSKKHGIWRYAGGGGIEDLSRKMLPRLAQMDFTRMFAAAFPEKHQVRWYYSLASESDEDPDHYIGWDYLNNEYIEGSHPFRVSCFGIIEEDGTETPSNPPSGLAHDSITTSSSRASWVNGDTAPSVVTRVYRAPDVAGSPGAYVQVGELAAGVASFNHTALAANTTYWTKVTHVRNGTESTAVEDDFTTLDSGGGGSPPEVPPPENFGAENAPIWNGSSYTMSALLSWSLAQSGLRTQIYRAAEDPLNPGNPDTYYLIATTTPDATSYRDTDPSFVANAEYWYKAKCKDAANNLSDFCAADSVVVTDTL